VKLSTESLARASSRRPWVTVAVWVLVMLGSGALVASMLQGALTTEFDFTNEPESKKAAILLEEHMDLNLRKANEVVIVRSDSLTVDSPEFQQQVSSVYSKVMALGPSVVDLGYNYYMTGDESLVSKDRRKTIIPFVMAGDLSDAHDNVHQIVDIVHETDASPQFDVLIVGDASIAAESNEYAERDLRRGEAFAIPIAIVILVLVLGAVSAAFIPLMLAVVAIGMALAMTALVGQAFEMSFFVVNMITMMGLAVGIDYSLFIIARYREERAKGRDKLDAISASGATAGRAIFFSGLTVVLALAGLVLVPGTIFRSLGIGAILVVIAAVLATMTLLPAVLSIMGDKVNLIRIPRIGLRTKKAEDNGGAGGFWNWVTYAVMKRPWVFLLITVGALVAAAVPFKDIETGFNGISTFPDSSKRKAAFAILDTEFSFGRVAPARIVVHGDIASPEVQAAIGRLRDALSRDPAFVGPSTVQPSPDGAIALVTVPVAGDPGSEVSVSAIKRLRSDILPAALAGTTATALVTGATAFNVDFFHITDTYMPIVFAVVLSLSFVLLTIVFRSIVVPLKAIIMNLLSVGAAYGLVVLVTQKGVGAELLGLHQSHIIDAWIPLFLFSVLFGLSMDYHVFLLSRIRERYDITKDNAGSVAYGLRSTAGLITGAAVIMVAVFGGFAAGEMVMFQQVGFGLAVAVFLDATIVRSVLVPASMKLLGHRNWYFPRALRWLPDVRVEASEAPENKVHAK